MTEEQYSPTDESFGIDDHIVDSTDASYHNGSKELAGHSSSFRDPPENVRAEGYNSINNTNLSFNVSRLLGENGNISNGRRHTDATDLRSNRPKQNARRNVAVPPRSTQMTLKEQERVSTATLD
jgi:hypothetical protein